MISGLEYRKFLERTFELDAVRMKGRATDRTATYGVATPIE
jgi:hypothetical protein